MKNLRSLSKIIIQWLYTYRYPILLICILIWGIFLRLYRLRQFPPGLYPDVGANGLDAQDLLHGKILPFYYRNGGREGMIFYLEAIFVLIFDNTPLALYVTTSIIGIISILVMYLFGKTFFNRNIGLLSSFFMASSFYHLMFSRWGYRVVLLPLFLMLSILLLKRAYQSGKNIDWIYAGIVFGLGFYTYIAYRIFPVVLILTVILFWKKFTKPRITLSGLVAFIVSGLVTSLPLILYAYKYPFDILGRTYNASVVATSQGSLISNLFHNFLSTLGMFAVSGEPLLLYNIPRLPMLTIFEGILALTGLVISLIHWRRPINSLLIILFGSMLLPIMLSNDIPHILRGFGLVVPLFTFMAVGLEKFYTFLIKKNYQIVATVLVILILISSVYTGYHRYFTLWAQEPNLEKEFYVDLVAMTSHIKEAGYDQPIYIMLDAARWGPKDIDILEVIPGEESPSVKKFLERIISTFKYKHPFETNIDHNGFYFWEGNTVKYLLSDPQINYEVRHPEELDQKESGVYFFSNLWHPDFKDKFLSVFPQSKLLESNTYFEAWKTE